MNKKTTTRPPLSHSSFRSERAPKLEKLNQEIKSCRKCPLWKMRKNAVPGEGPLNAKIMIIGEAAGSMEDKTGKPFCGLAGKFLDKLLKIAEIDRRKIYITSVLKCRPVNYSKNKGRK